MIQGFSITALALVVIGIIGAVINEWTLRNKVLAIGFLLASIVEFMVLVAAGFGI